MTHSPPARVQLDFYPAVRLAAIMAAVPAAAGGILLWLLSWPAGPAAALLFSALGCVIARDRGLLKGPRAITCLELRDDGVGVLRLRNGEAIAAGADGALVRRWVVVLRTECASRHYVLIVREMLAQSDWRALRLWALWGRIESGSHLQTSTRGRTRTISNC